MSNKKITWETKEISLDEMILSEINPRKVSEENLSKLNKSLKKFNLAELPVLNKDLTVLAGNQRIVLLRKSGAKKIPVRIPSRQLTDEELKEYMLQSNTHAGEFDFDKLAKHFSGIDLKDLTIELPKLAPFTPNTTPGQENIQVTEKDVEKAKEKIEKKYSDATTFTEEIICPYCYKTFEASKKE